LTAKLPVSACGLEGAEYDLAGRRRLAGRIIAGELGRLSERQL